MTGKTAAQLVQEARQRVENLTVAQVAREMQEEGALLVDIREPGEDQKEGVIPGAIAAPRGMLEFWADPSSPYHRSEFSPERRVILHCASGGRSALAADTLRQMGYSRVAHLDGGIRAWTQEGQPVSRPGT